MDTPTNKKPNRTITWRAPEYRGKKKEGTDWYIALIVIALSGTLSAIIFHNILFAILIIVGTLTIIIFALKEPRIIEFSVTPQEIIINGEKYPLASLDSFWITHQDGNDYTLIVQSKKLLLNHLSIPLNKNDFERIRSNLRMHLPEKEIYEPLFEQIAHRLGL